MARSGQDRSSHKRQEPGRDKLLEAARCLFREQVKHEVSRQDIARKAGVAPGLLTYHFQTNVELILAATHPVLVTAIDNLIAALDSPASCEERFRQCVRLFLDFAEDNASILDIYVQTAIESGDGDAQALIGATLDRLGRFFIEAVEEGLVSKETNPQFLLLALWGVCRLVGGTRPYPLPILDGEGRPGDTRQIQIDLISRLVLFGVGDQATAAQPQGQTSRSPRRSVSAHAPSERRRARKD